MRNVTIRPLKRDDRSEIEKLLSRVKEFRKEDVACALELFDDALKNGNSDEDYAFFCAEKAKGEIVGFLCYGKTPLTKTAYDLYWIVTDPRYHRSGIGGHLLRHIERSLGKKETSLLVAETSSLPSYEKARSFYEKQGFHKESRIKDFYAPGDDRLIYCKRYRADRSSDATHP